MRQGERRRSRLPGFTLIEILIVVTIIVIVFGFAMPTLSQYLSNQKLKSVTGRLARGLAVARTRAITKHQDHFVVFFDDRLVVVSERPETPSVYPYFASRREAGKMRIALRFAGAAVEEMGNKEHPFGLTSDLAQPPDEDLSKPISARTLLGGLDSGLVEGKRAFLRFRSDGTVTFGPGEGPGDRLSIDFWAEPPRDADFIVQEQGNKTRGWIDVRATGAVSTFIKEGAPKEQQSEGSNS
jgi:prepilin-type N-terminal cleavage/methylation domain-containing protein